VSILWGSVAFNFYEIMALIMVIYTVVTDNVHGPLRDTELALKKLPNNNTDTVSTASKKQAKALADFSERTMVPATKARYMLVPLMTMVISMFVFMYWTGHGDITAGSGSKSVLYATCLALAVGYFLLRFSNHFTHKKLVEVGFKGIAELLPLVVIVLLSLTLGASLKDLGTGLFIAGVVGEHLPIIFIVPMLFLAGAIMSFSTGTSWGTFAILIPIGVPLIQTLGLPPSLVIAAILGGGIFGDHCSPISDTTAVSSIASGCDLLEHVKTQMPYALFGGAVTLIAYFIASMVLL
jgi:Na+/H+ antiporter NhaC